MKYTFDGGNLMNSSLRFNPRTKVIMHKVHVHKQYQIVFISSKILAYIKILK